MEELVGFTLTSFEWHEDGYGDDWPRFTAERGDEKIIIEVSRDPEGNGAGHLFYGPADDYDEEG